MKKLKVKDMLLAKNKKDFDYIIVKRVIKPVDTLDKKYLYCVDCYKNFDLVFRDLSIPEDIMEKDFKTSSNFKFINKKSKKNGNKN